MSSLLIFCGLLVEEGTLLWAQKTPGNCLAHSMGPIRDAIAMISFAACKYLYMSYKYMKPWDVGLSFPDGVASRAGAAYVTAPWQAVPRPP